MPIHCTVEGGLGEGRHYGVTYFCQRTGLHYCFEHSHSDSDCCRHLPYEVWTENIRMAEEMGLSKKILIPDDRIIFETEKKRPPGKEATFKET